MSPTVVGLLGDGEIFTDNDLIVSVDDLMVTDPLTGVESPQVGWTDLKCKIAATDPENAAAIDPVLDIVMVADTLVPNTYRCVFQGSDLTAKLIPTYTDLPVFFHAYRLQDFHSVRTATVRRARLTG